MYSSTLPNFFLPSAPTTSTMSAPETTKRPAEDVADSSEDESRPPRKKHLPKRTCLVCDVERSINQFPSSKRVSSHDHGSNVYRPCFLRHVEVEIDSKNWDQVACPECEIVLEYNEVKKMTSAEKFEKYEEASLRAALAEDGDYRHCFSPTCNAGQLHTGGEDEPIFRCGTCGHKHCVACEANWHEDETCTQYQDRRRVERGVENDQSQQEVEKLSKPCPKCKVPIEKNYGCDHMTCSRCRHHFCWICSAEYRQIFAQGNHRHAEGCTHYRALPSVEEQEAQRRRAEEARQ